MLTNINFFVNNNYIMMNIFCENIEKLTLDNTNYRHVLYTGKHIQLVVMSLNPKEEIDLEIHSHTDQFIRIEKGTGIATINEKDEKQKKEYKLIDGISIIIPANTWHRITNTSDTEQLKLYTLYAPPEHESNKLQITKSQESNSYQLYKQKKQEYITLKNNE